MRPRRLVFDRAIDARSNMCSMSSIVGAPSWLRSPAMQFSGTVYFDFESKNAWRLFLLLTEAAREGVKVDADWVGYVQGDLDDPHAMSAGARALAAHAAVAEPQRRQVLRTGLFTLIHRQGDTLDDELTIRAAAKVAGVDADTLFGAIPASGHAALRDGCARARQAGVVNVPSIVRHGSPLYVATTPALAEGAAKPRLVAIDQMLEDDGLWRLEKP